MDKMFESTGEEAQPTGYSGPPHHAVYSESFEAGSFEDTQVVDSQEQLPDTTSLTQEPLPARASQDPPEATCIAKHVEKPLQSSPTQKPDVPSSPTQKLLPSSPTQKPDVPSSPTQKPLPSSTTQKPLPSSTTQKPLPSSPTEPTKAGVQARPTQRPQPSPTEKLQPEESRLEKPQASHVEKPQAAAVPWTAGGRTANPQQRPPTLEVQGSPSPLPMSPSHACEDSESCSDDDRNFAPPPMPSAAAIDQRLRRIFKKKANGNYAVPEEVVKLWLDKTHGGREKVMHLFEKFNYETASRQHVCMQNPYLSASASCF